MMKNTYTIEFKSEEETESGIKISKKRIYECNEEFYSDLLRVICRMLSGEPEREVNEALESPEPQITPVSSNSDPKISDSSQENKPFEIERYVDTDALKGIIKKVVKELADEKPQDLQEAKTKTVSLGGWKAVSKNNSRGPDKKTQDPELINSGELLEGTGFQVPQVLQDPEPIQEDKPKKGRKKKFSEMKPKEEKETNKKTPEPAAQEDKPKKEPSYQTLYYWKNKERINEQRRVRNQAKKAKALELQAEAEGSQEGKE